MKEEEFFNIIKNKKILWGITDDEELLKINTEYLHKPKNINGKRLKNTIGL